MIYLFHGDDTFNSRQRLFNALNSYQQVRRLSKKEITTENLATFNTSLFSQIEKKATVLEGLFSLTGDTLKEMLRLISSLEKGTDVFIWEEKTLTPARIASLGKDVRSSVFKLPVMIFKFLDSVGESNPEILIKNLNAGLKTHPPELILFLLEKRFRDLLIAKISPELLKTSPWQKNNLISQSTKLSLEQIEQMYLKLIEVEWRNKSGQLGSSLENELFNLIIELTTNEKNN